MTALSLQTVWEDPVEKNVSDPKLVALPIKEGYQLVNQEEIIYCKAEGNYTLVMFLNGKRLLISRKLKDTVAGLGNDWFIRIHQSYLVNMKYARQYVRKTGGQLIMSDGAAIPISRTYKEQVLNLFNIV